VIRRHFPGQSHQSVVAFHLLLLFALLLTTPSGLSAAGGLMDYNGIGLTFHYPANWAISASGNQVRGNISVMDSCCSIAIAWMRDPGLTPASILDQISKTYNQGEVEIISKVQGKIPVQGREAETMDLSYKFKDNNAKKRLAAWTSEGSDRLFIASMSSCSVDYSRNEDMLNQVIGSFHDQESREISLEARRVRDDAWAIVLGDLLGSYHYIDQSALSSAAVYTEAAHSLTPVNGSYRLMSTEKIRSEMSRQAVNRADVIQKLLQARGYNAVLIQKAGVIWVVVLDPSGRWQSVSMNPKEPWRMVGAQVIGQDGYNGLLYKNITALVEDNSIALKAPNDSNDSGEFVQKDCDPPMYAELKGPAQENKTWTNELQSVLDGYSYPEKYQENIFDCSNTSQICWELLESKGYDARLMFSYKDHPLGRHMWVVVRYPYEDENYVAVEATNTNGNGDLLHLGRVVLKDDYFNGIMYNTSMQFSWLHPEEGMWLKPGQ
jgi:hypothetical protein